MKIGRLHILSFLVIGLWHGCNASAQKFDAKKVMRLITTVDPDTCQCIAPSARETECKIEIPGVKLIGIKCPGSGPFCCHSRGFVKPFVTPADLAALHAAAKRFNVNRGKVEQIVRSQVGKDLVNMTTTEGITKLEENEATQTSTTTEEPTTEATIPTTTKSTTSTTTSTTTTSETTTTTTSTTTTSETTTTAAPTTSEKKQSTNTEEDTSGCSCVSANLCEQSMMDFTFGKSCPFGLVRCCDDTSAIEATTVTTVVAAIMTDATPQVAPHRTNTSTAVPPFQRHSVPAFHLGHNNNGYPRAVFHRPTPIHVYGLGVNNTPRKHYGHIHGGVHSPIQPVGPVHYPSFGLASRTAIGGQTTRDGFAQHMAQDRKITVGSSDEASDFSGTNNVNKESIQQFTQEEHQTQQEKNYAQYVKHVQHQKEVILEQHEKNHPPAHPPLRQEPLPGKAEEVVSDFQSWLIGTGKRLFRVLG